VLIVILVYCLPAFAQHNKSRSLSIYYERCKTNQERYFKSEEIAEEDSIIAAYKSFIKNDISFGVQFSQALSNSTFINVHARLRIAASHRGTIILPLQISGKWNVVGQGNTMLTGNTTIEYGKRYQTGRFSIAPSAGLSCFYRLPPKDYNDSSVYIQDLLFTSREQMQYYAKPIKFGFEAATSFGIKLNKKWSASMRIGYTQPFNNDYTIFGAARYKGNHSFWRKYRQKLSTVYGGVGFVYKW
jgi:hypothetical protein